MNGKENYINLLVNIYLLKWLDEVSVSISSFWEKKNNLPSSIFFFSSLAYFFIFNVKTTIKYHYSPVNMVKIKLYNPALLWIGSLSRMNNIHEAIRGS